MSRRGFCWCAVGASGRTSCVDVQGGLHLLAGHLLGVLDVQGRDRAGPVPALGGRLAGVDAVLALEDTDGDVSAQVAEMTRGYDHF